MASSIVEIYNMALGHLGSLNQVASTTEQSAEAMICNLYYTQALNLLLDDCPWPFAKKIAPLIPVGTIQDGPPFSNGGAPTQEFLFSFLYPPDCVRMQRLYSSQFVTNENIIWDIGWTGGWDQTQNRLPFIIVPDPKNPNQNLVYTNWDSIYAWYTTNTTSVAMYPPKFVDALTWLLAAFIAPKVTAGEPNTAEKMKAQFERSKAEAKAAAFNEQQDPALPESEFISTRDSYSLGPIPGPYPWQMFPGGYQVL